MPNPLPLAMIKLQRFPIRLSSPALNVAPLNGVSVIPSVPPAAGPLVEWTLVPKASMPFASAAVPTVAAEFVQVPPTGTGATDQHHEPRHLAGGRHREHRYRNHKRMD